METRKNQDFVLLEGRRLVEDALSRGIKPKLSAITPEYEKTYGKPAFPYLLISDKLLNNIADTSTPQGILMVVDRPKASLSDIKMFDELIILDGVQDPGNVGTIIRTAEAFGIQGIIITKECASPFSQKAIRSSMGSCFGVKIVHASADEIKNLPHTIFSFDLGGKEPFSRALFKGKIALCFGQEGSGISKEILKISHKRIYIPMKGHTESLNVAVSAGIAMACVRGIL